jgi:two-component system, sensor histidine kinase and response regulator
MSSASGHILLAEDHPVNQRVATAMLEHLGFDVDVVADGAEAVTAATHAPYQAILMDCQIPVLDGYQATGEIRRLEGASSHIPIIAVTGSGKSDQRRCLAAGMDDFLTKPLTLKALAEVLDRWALDAPDATDSADPGDVLLSLEDGRSSRVPDSVPVLDPRIVDRLARLGEAAGEDLIGQLALLFLADAADRVVALHEAIGANDEEAIVFLAHAQSGASANIGATKLARLCATLETDGAVAAADDALDAIEAELEQVRLALGVLTRP